MSEGSIGASLHSSQSLKRSADEEPSGQAKRVRLDTGLDAEPTIEKVDKFPAQREGTVSKKSKHDSRRNNRSGKGKDNKKGRRRGTRNEEDANEIEGLGVSGSGEPVVKTPRLPKRQCALLIGFCGTGCNGMQMYVSM